MQRNAEESAPSSSTVNQFHSPKLKNLDGVAWRPPLFEDIHLRLGLEPTWLGLKPTWPGLESSQNPVWDLNHGLLTRITHLVPGLTEAQLLCISAQKEFRKAKCKTGNGIINIGCL